MTSANDIELEEEDSDSFALDAETGTDKHGVRLHADSPDGEWKNVEMTGYFKLNEGNDQFTLIARQGPTYNDNGGCGAYGYYGMLDANGDAYFKKKLFHHGGYTDRTAVRQGVVGDLNDRWVGIKMIAYNLDGGDVKLELWVDDGDETNNWQKATEYVDDGNWEVAGSDCGRSDDIIDEGTRGGFRVDDSQFEFKKLSIREIVGSGDSSETALMDEAAETADEGGEAAETADEGEPNELPTVEIVSNGIEGVAPATFEFDAHITGGTEPYAISWDFGDGTEGSDEQSVVHTFDEAGTYNVIATITDSDGQTVSDNLDVTVEEAATEEREGGQEVEEQ
ncbi:MAG: PKD domain-containing protein [Thermoproteota archaeon]|nr:PKD domain-containing protein [Thermoproteota archaeon]